MSSSVKKLRPRRGTDVHPPPVHGSCRNIALRDFTSRLSVYRLSDRVGHGLDSSVDWTGFGWIIVIYCNLDLSDGTSKLEWSSKL